MRSSTAMLGALALSAAQLCQTAGAVTGSNHSTPPGKLEVTSMQKACIAGQLAPGEALTAIGYNTVPSELVVTAQEKSGHVVLYQQKGGDMIFVRKSPEDPPRVMGQLGLSADNPQRGREASFSDPPNVTFIAMKPSVRRHISAMANCVGLNATTMPQP